MERQVTVAQVTSKNFLRHSQNSVLRGIVLVLKRSDRPLQMFRPQNSKLKRASPEGAYDRMAIIGQWNSKDCFAIIASSAQKSSKLFGDRRLTVGSLVEVKEPVYNNTCLGNDLNNPIFDTQRQIVVLNIPLDNLFPPVPVVLQPQTTAMFHYTLPTRRLLFLHANIISPTCAGYLCDRRVLKNDSLCACLQKSSLSSWTVSARIITADIDEEDEDILSGDITQSHQMSLLFCSDDVLRLPASSIDIDVLRDVMENISQHVNDNGGWIVSGYYKSSASEEMITQEVHRIRICRIVPSAEIPGNLKYNIGEADDAEDAPPRLVHANPNVINDQ